MRQQHPLVILALWWLAAMLIVVAGWCALPSPQPATLATPTRLPLTVLPTQTVYVFAPASPSTTPLEALLLPTRTPGPSPTRTPMPTATPVPPTPDRPPVQRG